MGLTLILLLAALVAVLAPFAEPVAEASGAPGSVGSVSLSRADSTVTASWGAVSGATRYHATYSTDGGGSWHAPVSGHRNITSTSITFGADNASTYIVGVRAGNDQGWGSWTNSSPAGPFVPPKRTPTPTPTPEPTPTPTPTPKPPAKPPTAPSVTAARGEDATTATVSWTKYTGDDFDYYRFVVCPAANFIGGTCSNNVFTSDAYYDAGTTGPVKVTGLDASTGYGVILQVWRRGGAGALKPNTTIPAAAPSPTPTPTKPTRSLTFGSHTVGDQSWTKDTAIDTLTLPAATVSTDGLVGIAIVPAMTYTLSPALPAGVSFDATARTISGTPTAEAASATYTYTASADGHNPASLTFTIVVDAPAPALSFGSSTIDDQSFNMNTEIDTLTLPKATKSSDGASTTVGAITYSLSPTLPEGLSFDATARTITGTPTALADSAKYTYSATDGTDSAALSFAIEVLQEQGASAQAGLSWVTSPPTLLEWTQGVAVNVTLPAATGDPNITYKLSQGCGSQGADLPPGISWNASTRTLSGTPTKWFATRAACYQAYASNKSAPSVTIHIRASDTSGNHAPYASIKSSGSQLLGQLWSRYGDCYSGSVTYTPSSGHTKHFYDPEDDTLTYTAGSSKVVSTTINSSGYAVATLRHPPVNWYSFHYTATDPDGLYDSISLQVKHFDCTDQFGVNENLAAGTKVRTLGGGNAADGSSYTLSDGSDGDITSYFQVDSSTGEVTVKSGVTLDYETKTSHKGDFRYTVENTSVGGKIQINLNDIRAPTPDRPTLAQNSTNPTTALDVSWTAVTAPTGHTVNDYDVRYREWTTSTWTEMPDTTNSTATSATITGLTAGKEYEVQVRASINSEGDGHWSGSSVILYLAENTAVNGNVGGKFNVNATDFWPLSFTLGGTDGSKFKTSNDTGYKTAQSAQIQVKTGNVPDFESKSSYSLTLRAVENNLQRNILDITYSILIIVTDVSEPPGKPAAPTVAVNSTTPTTKLDVSWTAPTMTGKPAISDYDVQYRQTGDSSWTSHSFTGTGTSTTLSSLTAGKKYDVQVRATNAEGTGSWSDTGNAITTSSTVTRSIAENSAASTNIGAAVTMTPGTYTLAHSLDGTDKSKFDIGSTTGQITVKTGNVPDYESTTSYSVEVKIAVSGTGNAKSEPNGTGDYTVPVTINVTDVNEPPPKLSAPTVAKNSTTPDSKLDVSWTAPTTTQMSGKPAVSDYDVQYRQNGGSTWSSHSFTGTGTSTTLTGLTKGKSYEVQVSAVNAEGNGDWSDSGSAITDANAVTRNVAENSASGTNVGAAVTAVSTNTSYTYTHALSGTDAGKFEIGSTTGQITVKSGTSLDYETKTSYTVTVTVTAAAKSQGANAQSVDPNAPGDYIVPVTINVTDVNEPPAFAADTATRSIAENSAAGTSVGAVVTATDPDGVAKFNTLTYSLTGTDASDFTIDSSTGQIKTKSALDYEDDTSYSVTVNVTDGKNASGTADTTADDTIAVTINVTDVAEPPAAPAAPTVAQNSTTPTTKLDVSWTAPTNTGKPAIDDYDVQYRKSGDSTWSSHSFTGTGTSTTLTGLTAGKTYEVQVRAVNDEGDGAWSASGTAITKGGSVTRSIDENSAAGSNVGAAVTASNTSYTYTHALSGTDAGKFEIGSSTGQITVKSGTTLNYESGTTSYSVVVTVTAAAKSQGAGAQSVDPNAPGDYVIPVTINVDDVAEPPPAPDAPTVTQNTATPKTKLDVSWTALTTTQMAGKPAVTDYDVQYKKTSDSTWTEWNASDDGTTTSTTITGLTEGTEYEVQVRATNDEGDSGWSTSGKTNTQDKNVHADFPDTTATRSVAENTAAGGNVGAAVTANDTENHTLYYSLNGTDKDEFDIGLNTGQITVKSGSIPNYEAKTSYSLTVEVSDRKDSDDNADEKIDDTIAVTINVTDVAEPPAAPALTVANNATTPKTKIDVSWTAPDMTGKPAISDYDVEYRLSGGSTWTDASFSGTGTSTTLSGLTEGKSYEVQVRAVNDEGNGAWASGSAITDANAVSRDIAENSPAGTNVGAAVTAKSTNTSYTYTHALSGTDASSFNIGSSSGRITVKSGNIPDFETKKSYTVTVTVTAAAKSQGGASAQSVDPNAPGDYVVPVTINVTDVNEPPEFAADTATRSIAENSAANTSIGAVVTATDPDTNNTNFNTLTYSLTGTDASDFTIDSSTGQIKTKSALDYEDDNSYSVTVNVTDGKNASGTADTTIDDTIAVTISVTDVNEPPAALDGPTVEQNTGARDTKLDVSWTALTSTQMAGKPPVTDYDVQYKKTSDSTWTDHPFNGTGISTTLTGLTYGTQYEVQVRAVNHEGNGPWSTSGSGWTQDFKVAKGSVNENVSGGTAVTASLPQLDDHGHPITYSITSDVVVNGQVASAASSAHNEFTIDSKTGQIRVRQGVDLDYESTHSHVITIKASHTEPGHDHVNALITVTISITDVAEAPAPPNAPSVAPTASAPRTSLDVSWTAPNTSDRPAVTDYDVQYKKSDATGWRNHLFIGSGTSTTLTGLDSGAEYEVQVRATNDEGSSTWSPSGTGSTLSNKPEFDDGDTATRTIAENSAAGTNVGAAIKATHPDGDPLTYGLGGTDAASFAIDSTTGQITVGATTKLDYEDTTSYSVTVEVSDGKDAKGNADTAIDDTIAVTIDVTDVNEPPDAPAAPTVTRNTGSPKTMLDAGWTAPDMTGKPALTGYDMQYRASGATGWTSHAFTGTGTSTTLTGLSEGTSYEVQVRATNDEGTSAWSASGSASTKGSNTDPSFGATKASRSVAENSAAGTAVGAPVTASDPDGNSLTYSLSGTDAGSFTIDGATGQIQVGAGTALDYESTTSYSVTVGTSDGLDSYGNADSSTDATIAVTINITDVNEPPGAPAAPKVTQGSDQQTMLDASWTAPNTTGIPPITDYDVQYRATGGTQWDDHSFDGTGTSTTVTSLTAGVYYEVRVRASNDEGTGPWSRPGSADTKAQSVTPIIIKVAPPQPVPPGAPDAPDVSPWRDDPQTALYVTWQVPSNDGPAITGYRLRYRMPGDLTWGSLKSTRTNATITDLTAATIYEVQVEAYNADGPGPWSPSGIGTTEDYPAPEPVNGAPRLGSRSGITFTVAENSTAGTAVGDPIEATDPDDDAISYTIDGANEFTIDPDTGQIRVARGAALDYEAVRSYTVTVGIGDGLDSDGNEDPAADDSTKVTIVVTDVDEPPAKADAPAVTQNADSPTDALIVQWDAPYNPGPAITGYDLRYRVKGATAWTAHPVEGTVTIARLDGLKSATVYEARVRAKNDEGAGPWSDSGAGATATANRASTFPSPGSGIARSVAENSPAGTLVGEPVTATDPNGDDLTYGMSGAGEFTIEPATGQIVVAEGAVLDYEAVRSYTVTVTVTDGVNFEGNPDTATDDSVLVTIYVIDVDESAPVSDAKIDDAKDLSAPAQTRKVEESRPWTPETPKPNSAPSLAAGAMFDVAENSAAGTLVGGPVDATDSDGDALRFTLDGALEFTIDSYTGQIAVARGADLDYEAVQSYTLTVTVSDGLDALGNEDPSADDSAQVTIYVTDADEPPARPDAPSVAQHPDAPTSGLVVEWAAPANTGPAITGYDLRFRVEGETAWITHPVTGSVTVASIANLQNASAYETQVRAVNDEGVGPWSDAGKGATAEPNAAPAITAPAPAPSAGESKPENPVTELVVARDSGPSEPAPAPTAAPSEATPEAAAGIISANLSSITWLLALAAALLAILIFVWKRRRKKRQAPAVQSA